MFMLAALVPIARMPQVIGRGGKAAESWIQLAKPFENRAFLGLLLFGCWFSFSNGLTQTLQFTFPKDVLGIGLFLMLALQTGMRMGQIGVSPYLGSAADRFGNKPMMLVCLLITAQGPLFYYFAAPPSWWWIIGAWICWIAYAGLNIGLPNLTLKIASRAEYADYLAIYYTCTGLCYGVNTLLSGWLFDRFGKYHWSWNGFNCDFNQAMFLLGWIARLVGIVFLWRVIEPNASETKS
jgi:MFS family permease